MRSTSGTGTVSAAAEHQAGRHLLRPLVDGAGREHVGGAERLDERAAGTAARPACGRSGCRGRPRRRRGRARRRPAAAGGRSRRTPRPTTPRRSAPSRLTSGLRSRSGSSWSCLSVEPFGQMKPWLNTSSRSPRMRVTRRRRRCRPVRSRARTPPRTAGRCGTPCGWRGAGPRRSRVAVVVPVVATMWPPRRCLRRFAPCCHAGRRNPTAGQVVAGIVGPTGVRPRRSVCVAGPRQRRHACPGAARSSRRRSAARPSSSASTPRSSSAGSRASSPGRGSARRRSSATGPRPRRTPCRPGTA